MPWTKEENILHNYLFGHKIIEKCLKIDAAHYYDDNLLKQEIRKRFNVPEADVKTIKKNPLIWYLYHKRSIFYRACSK